jgi:hypothetical protein
MVACPPEWGARSSFWVTKSVFGRLVRDRLLSPYLSSARTEIATGIKTFWDRKNDLIQGQYPDPVLLFEHSLRPARLVLLVLHVEFCFR